MHLGPQLFCFSVVDAGGYSDCLSANATHEILTMPLVEYRAFHVVLATHGTSEFKQYVTTSAWLPLGLIISLRILVLDNLSGKLIQSRLKCPHF